MKKIFKKKLKTKINSLALKIAFESVTFHNLEKDFYIYHM